METVPNELADIYPGFRWIVGIMMRGIKAHSSTLSMDVVLTGIPRSGTTLACFLLNHLPQCVALHEPLDPTRLFGLECPNAYLDKVTSFYGRQRASILRFGTAISKARAGTIPDNPFTNSQSTLCLRSSDLCRQEIKITKRLDPSFKLVIKHPNMFTATLPVLVTRFPCFAIVRNPLAVLLSWHSIEAPVNRGRIPCGEAFDQGLKLRLRAQKDQLSRQLVILGWYYMRYLELLPSRHIIRYEDVISTGGSALFPIDPAACNLKVPLKNLNTNKFYSEALVKTLADHLISDASIYSPFYSASDIEDLLARWAK